MGIFNKLGEFNIIILEVDKWLIFRWLQFIFPVIRRLALPRTFNYTHNHYVFSQHILTFCKQWKSRLNFCRLCETLAMNLSFMGILWYSCYLLNLSYVSHTPLCFTRISNHSNVQCKLYPNFISEEGEVQRNWLVQGHTSNSR